MQKKFIFLSLAMNLISILLSLINLFYPKWFKISGEDWGLVFCSSCNSLHKNWTWECLARLYCSESSSNCSLYTQAYKSTTLFIILDSIKSIFTILTLNRLILIMSNKSYGSFLSLLLLILFSVFLKISGLLLWIMTFWIKYKDECNLGIGSFLNIGITVWEVITGFVSILIIWRVPDSNEDFFVKSFRCGINRKVFMSIAGVLLTAGIFMNILSINDTKWVFDEYTGTLIRCKDCEPVNWLPWHCISASACEINSSSSECKTYLKYSIAGSTYLIFSLVSSVLSIQVLDFILSCVLFSNLGLYNLNLLYFIFSVICQAVGFLYWTFKSQGNIEISNFISNSLGIIFSLLGIGFSALGFIFFLISKPQIGVLPEPKLFSMYSENSNQDSPVNLNSKTAKVLARPNSLSEIPPIKRVSMRRVILPSLSQYRPTETSER